MKQMQKYSIKFLEQLGVTMKLKLSRCLYGTKYRISNTA